MRSAVCAGETIVAERVSMPAFNRVKLDVDRARGLTDPRRDPERTPTADAIQMRFKELAGRPVACPSSSGSPCAHPSVRRCGWRRCDARRHVMTSPTP